MSFKLRFCCLTLIIIGMATLPVWAQPDPAQLAQVESLQNTLADVAVEVGPSVVAIRADRKIDTTHKLPDDEIHRHLQEQMIPAVGSGLIIRADGMILTNEHVIHNAKPQDIECILANGQSYTVQHVTSDPRSDIAVLKIDAKNLQPARLGDVKAVRQGHFVIVMGNPFGSASDSRGRPAMTFGIISALGQDLTRKLDPAKYYGNLIQTDARINPGNSGGPLLDIWGEVIGLTTAISTRSGSSEGVGYAIPIDKLTKRTIEQLMQGEEIEYGFLGIQLDSLPAKDGVDAGTPEGSGALIKDVILGTPAAVANLQAGDIIVQFDNEPVDSVDKVIRLVGAAHVGVQVKMAIYRNRQQMIVPITPARRPLPDSRTIEWRGMKIDDPSWEVCHRFNLPLAQKGVVVTHVHKNSSAAKAGLEPGNVILQIGQIKARSVRQLSKIIPEMTGRVKIIVGGEPTEERILP